MSRGLIGRGRLLLPMTLVFIMLSPARLTLAAEVDVDGQDNSALHAFDTLNQRMHVIPNLTDGRFKEMLVAMGFKQDDGGLTFTNATGSVLVSGGPSVRRIGLTYFPRPSETIAPEIAASFIAKSLELTFLDAETLSLVLSRTPGYAIDKRNVQKQSAVMLSVTSGRFVGREDTYEWDGK